MSRLMQESLMTEPEAWREPQQPFRITRIHMSESNFIGMDPFAWDGCEIPELTDELREWLAEEA